jgi:V-type H+-transporting ATPase subunit e
MTAIPTTLITGTICYLVMGLVAIGVVMSSRATGALSKDNAEIGNVVVAIATFSMWLFWMCAWLHQWHPLIKPIYEG